MARGSKSKRNRSGRRRTEEDIEAGTSNSSSRQNNEGLPSSHNHKDLGEIGRLSTNYNTTNRSWTIVRVPNDLKEVNRESFAPKMISIGPFHYGKPQYENMDNYKRFCQNRLLEFVCVVKSKELQASGDDDEPEEEEEEQQPDKVYQKLVVAMKSLEDDTRKCYSEKFDSIDSEAFVRMMILDGCFVIEHLRLVLLSNLLSKSGNVTDDIFTKPGLLPTIQSDLLKLENQLPFFVLERLYQLTNVTNKGPELTCLTLPFFKPLLRQLNFDEDSLLISLEIYQSQENHNLDHLLSIFYSFFLIPNIKTSPADNSLEHLHQSAMELRELGITLKKKMDHHLLDIDFKKRALEIPTLTINENTVSLYLNFVAYEQCDDKTKPFFTSYFLFFDDLINTQSDVEILVRNGIMNQEFGSNKEVANFFNKFSRGIPYRFDVRPWYYSKQIQDVNKHCTRYYANQYRQRSWNFCDKYFSNPWSFLSLLGALALLSLTTTQTFYAVYAYYYPRS